MSTKRQVAEGTQYQGVDEQLYYVLDVSNYGDDPTGVAVVVKDTSDGDKAVTDTVTTGDASVSDNEITLPKIHGLTAEHTYRVEVKFTISSNVFEPYFYIKAEV